MSSTFVPSSSCQLGFGISLPINVSAAVVGIEKTAPFKRSFFQLVSQHFDDIDSMRLPLVHVPSRRSLLNSNDFMTRGRITAEEAENILVATLQAHRRDTSTTYTVEPMSGKYCIRTPTGWWVPTMWEIRMSSSGGDSLLTLAGAVDSYVTAEQPASDQTTQDALSELGALPVALSFSYERFTQDAWEVAAGSGNPSA